MTACPSLQSEAEGQSEAIATNLLVMAGLKVPLIAVVIGEGGSGGALMYSMSLYKICFESKFRFIDSNLRSHVTDFPGGEHTKFK